MLTGVVFSIQVTFTRWKGMNFGFFAKNHTRRTLTQLDCIKAQEYGSHEDGAAWSRVWSTLKMAVEQSSKAKNHGLTN